MQQESCLFCVVYWIQGFSGLLFKYAASAKSCWKTSSYTKVSNCSSLQTRVSGQAFLAGILSSKERNSETGWKRWKMVWLTRSCSHYLTVCAICFLHPQMWFPFLFSKTVLRKASVFSQDIKEQKLYSYFFSHNLKYPDVRDARGKEAGIKKDHSVDVGVTQSRIMLELVSPLEETFTWRICNLLDSYCLPRGNRKRGGREDKCKCRQNNPDLHWKTTCWVDAVGDFPPQEGAWLLTGALSHRSAVSWLCCPPGKALLSLGPCSSVNITGAAMTTSCK